MASSGPNSPSTSASTSIDPSDIAWSQPTESQSSNNAYANVSFTNIDERSEALDNTNFGFSIPGGATIDGVVVEIEKAVTDGSVIDWTVQLIKGGTAQGDNNAEIGVGWPGSDAYTTYGGASDLWGLTLAPSDINATNFGVRLRCAEAGVDMTATGVVDHVRITIHYTDAAGVSRLMLMGVGP